MRLIATVVVGLVVGCGPATGGPGDGGNDPGPIDDPAINGEWSGLVAWQWGDGAPVDYEHSVSVTAGTAGAAGSLSLRGACYGAPRVQTTESITLLNGAWEDAEGLACVPFSYSSCGTGTMAITYRSAAATVNDALTELVVTFEAEGTHCGQTHDMQVVFTGRPSGG